MSKFFQDTMYLYLNRASAVVVPLLVVPNLISAMPPWDLKYFLVIVSSFQVMTMFIEAGLGLFAVRALSDASIDNNRISQITTNLMAFQFCVAFLLTLVVGLVALILGAFMPAIIILMLSLICFSFIPDWYFVGRQINVQLSLYLVASRLLGAIILIYFCRKGLVNLTSALFLNFLYLFLCAPLCIIRLTRHRMLAMDTLEFSALTNILREVSPYALSRLLTAIYTVGPTLILSFLVAPTTLGGYYLIDKLKNALAYIIGPMTTKLFPYLRTRYGHDLSGLLEFFRRLFLLVGVFCMVSFLILLVFQAPIASSLHSPLLAGNLAPLLLALNPLLLMISNFFGANILLSFGFTRDFNLTLLSGAVTILVLTVTILLRPPSAGGLLAFLFGPEIVVTIVSVWLFLTRRSDIRHIERAISS